MGHLNIVISIQIKIIMDNIGRIGYTKKVCEPNKWM